jgi:FAD/FMN-containing dehydrogenase
MIAEIPYVGMQSAIDDPPGFRNWWSAEYLTGLPDEALDKFVEWADEMPTPTPSQHILFPLGGAVARGASDSPLAFREAPWAVHPLGLWEDAAQDEQGVRWARGTCEAMKPYSVGATYLNFLGDEGENRIISGYGRENYDRLAKVKAEFDPDAVFHLHHPIRPLAAA